MKALRIASGLALPIDTTTQAIGIVAKRRVGKSYTARRIAEQLLHGGQQLVIVDPKGDWWGIRSSADGRSPGFPVVILGGERGDVPLEVSAGEVIAKLVVEERVSVLLDLSLFRKHEVTTFMTAFLENLYRLKAREQYRTPVMVIVDEADAIMPQKPQKGEERMLGAGEDIVRRGGQRGIGCMLITQRTAVLNKNVLTQVQLLVALRTIAPQDLKAMDAWIDVHGTADQRKTLMESLPSLPVGDAWFWSPGWPDVDGIFKRVHVLPIETFDSGATPKAGEKRVEPKNLADVDLEALTRQMAATIEKAKASDPKLLQKEIAKLKSELAKRDRAPAAKSATAAVADDKAIARATAQLQRQLESSIAAIKKQVRARVAEIRGNVGRAREQLDFALNRLEDLATIAAGSDAPPHLSVPSRPAAAVVERTAPAARPAARPAKLDVVATSEGVSRPQQRMLNALATIAELTRSDRAPRNVIAALSGQSPKSSGWDKNLSTLRTKGLIAYPSSDTMSLTPDGTAIATPDASITSLADLHAAWRDLVSGPQWRMLDALIAAYPDAMDRSALAASSGQSPASSGWDKNLSTLRSLGVIDYPNASEAVATELLFPPGLS